MSSLLTSGVRTSLAYVGDTVVTKSECNSPLCTHNKPNIRCLRQQHPALAIHPHIAVKSKSQAPLNRLIREVLPLEC